MKFEMYQSTKNSEWYFRLKAENGQVILSSEGYTSKGGCENGIASVKKNGKEKHKFETQVSSNGRYYFNLLAGNNQVIGKSQMYSSQQACEKGVDAVMQVGESTPIELLENSEVK